MPTKIFYSRNEVALLCGLKPLTLKRFRFDGTFTEGLHFIKVSPKVLLYNAPLIQDLLANTGDPVAHQRAIREYRASLPSGDKGYFKNLKAA
jgi:hypothetical protein